MENGTFCDHTKSPSTTKIGVSAGTGENPKWHFWFPKCHFGNRPKAGFTTCDTQKLCSAETTIFIGISAKHSFAEIKECKLKNNINLPRIGDCLQKCKKGVFWGLFFCFLVVLFFAGAFYKTKTQKHRQQKTKPPKNKKQTKKHLFLHFCKQSPIFGKFMLFFNLHSFISTKLCFAEITIK